MCEISTKRCSRNGNSGFKSHASSVYPRFQQRPRLGKTSDLLPNIQIYSPSVYKRQARTHCTGIMQSPNNKTSAPVRYVPGSAEHPPIRDPPPSPESTPAIFPCVSATHMWREMPHVRARVSDPHLLAAIVMEEVHDVFEHNIEAAVRLYGGDVLVVFDETVKLMHKYDSERPQMGQAIKKGPFWSASRAVFTRSFKRIKAYLKGVDCANVRDVFVTLWIKSASATSVDTFDALLPEHDSNSDDQASAPLRRRVFNPFLLAALAMDEVSDVLQRYIDGTLKRRCRDQPTMLDEGMHLLQKLERERPHLCDVINEENFSKAALNAFDISFQRISTYLKGAEPVHVLDMPLLCGRE